MKIALLGKGKTGSKVLELATTETEVFDRSNAPTFEKLHGFDVIISFLPGEAFSDLIPMLVETKIPVVTGSTGFKWPNMFQETLKSKNISWIYGSNFSLGVVVVKQMIENLNRASTLFSRPQVSIHEVHHTQKKDAPSGTALSMQEWYGQKCEITSERTGDVVGLHTLTFSTGPEKITVTHEALDRKLFAQGALWAAEFIAQKKLSSGLHSFQSVVEQQLNLRG